MFALAINMGPIDIEEILNEFFFIYGDRNQLLSLSLLSFPLLTKAYPHPSSDIFDPNLCLIKRYSYYSCAALIDLWGHVVGQPSRTHFTVSRGLAELPGVSMHTVFKHHPG